LDSRQTSWRAPGCRPVLAPMTHRPQVSWVLFFWVLPWLFVGISAAPGCSLHAPQNQADPTSQGFLVTQVMNCLLDAVCSHRLELLAGPGAGLGEGTLANLQTGQTKCFDTSAE